jgi:hypothetical protein
MRPLKGLVVKVAKDHMVIELRSGAKMATKKIGGYGRGTRVEIAYDFTHNRVRDIWREGERDVPILDPPRKLEEHEEVLELINKPEVEDVDEGAETDEEGASSVPEFEEVLEIEEWEQEQERLEIGASSSPCFGDGD